MCVLMSCLTNYKYFFAFYEKKLAKYFAILTKCYNFASKLKQLVIQPTKIRLHNGT